MNESFFESGRCARFFYFQVSHIRKEKYSQSLFDNLALHILFLFVMLLNENDNDNHYQ